MTVEIRGRVLTGGVASALLLPLDAPLSLWGGVDLATSTIVDASHPQRGQSIAGRIVVMREGRGSSSSSSALVELARRGLAPSAIILGRPDAILAIGALVAEQLYGLSIPTAVVPIVDHSRLQTAQLADVSCTDEIVATITLTR